MKRLTDAALAALGLVLASPVLIPAALAVFFQDGHAPWYVATRVGRGGRPFRMVKLRSMRVLADASGVTSTAGDDPRITAVGRFVRRWKIDEIPQLWNVLVGDMSLVGPRPQVQWAVDAYTAEERELLSVRPGMTDLASIVFADESEILHGAPDPDLRYEQLIRPWKSRLALVYVRSGQGMARDLAIVRMTVRAIADRAAALEQVARMVTELGGGEELAQIARRRSPLHAAPPPGASDIVRQRLVSA